MAVLLKRCLVEVEGSGEQERMPMACPMALMASSDRPPKVSATKGMHSAPIARQADRLEASFRRVPTSSAWPGMEDASAKVNCCSGEMTWTSTKAGINIRPLVLRTLWVRFPYPILTWSHAKPFVPSWV